MELYRSMLSAMAESSSESSERQPRMPGSLLEHAVEEIHTETCPSFWREAMEGRSFMRVGLQMRAA